MLLIILVFTIFFIGMWTSEVTIKLSGKKALTKDGLKSVSIVELGMNFNQQRSASPPLS